MQSTPIPGGECEAICSLPDAHGSSESQPGGILAALDGQMQ